MAQSVARQWPALPDATPESLQLWAKQITRLLQEGAIATGAQIDELDDLFLTPAEGDAAYVNVTGDTMTGELVIAQTATAASYVTAQTTDDGAVFGPQITVSRVSASPAANDLIGRFAFRGRDSAGNNTAYGYFQTRIDDPTDGSEDSSVLLGRVAAGAAVEEVIQTAGKQSIWVPAPAWKSFTTSGPGGLVTLEISAANSEIVTFDFDPSTGEFIHTKVAMPKSWNVGQISARVLWSHPATVTNFGVAWQLAAHATGDDDTLNFTHTAAVTVTDTGGTTNDLYVTAESSAFTIAGSPAAEDLISLRVARLVADGGDTMAVDAKFHGLMLYYTTNAPNDR